MKLKYDPALDGLRAVGALLVLFVHCHVPGFSGGARGVDVFFVLSGYLITSILRPEAVGGNIDIARFELARVRRLVPALLLFLAVYVAVCPLMFPDRAATRWLDVASAGAYLMDYTLLDHDLGRPLGHTWSLAVEAQFYLIWPLVMLWLAKLKDPTKALLFLWASLTFLRIAITAATADPVLSGYSLHNHATGLVLGAALACAPVQLPRLGWLGVALLAYVVAFNGADEIGNYMWRVTLSEVATVLIVADLKQPGHLRSALSWEPLRLIGLISYGLYLWHMPIARFFSDAHWLPRTAITLAASIGLATISYFTIERWIRQRFGHSPRSLQPSPQPTP